MVASPIPRRRFHDFQDLMRFRIMEVVLVSTPYDAFVLEEAGELSERLWGEFRNLDLHYAPRLTGVTSGAQALRLVREQPAGKLIVTTPELDDMDAGELAGAVARERLPTPVVLLAWDTEELQQFAATADISGIERSFVWQGDARILLAILKSVEDRRNVEHDTRAVGVQVILLVEDSVRAYSSFLPTMYTELLHHSQRVIAEGLNLSQKILRMRARPKVLLCTTFEEAREAFERYGDDVLGIISDVEFPKGGVSDGEAGAALTRLVRASYPDVPVVLHSSRAENAELARSLGASFLLKGSPHLLADLRRAMLEDLAFGDFVFRGRDGGEVARAANLRELGEGIGAASDETIRFHAERNHFSRWLKARTEFPLAHRLRPRRADDYPTIAALRDDLVRSIADYRAERSQMVVADLEPASFDLSSQFYRIGAGSIGGKARGLAFVRRLLAERELRSRFPGVEIAVPTATVLATDVFDSFLDDNDLRRFAIECEDDQLLVERFLAARFPEDAARDLGAFLERLSDPVAVRSSSLLEDSQHQPFAGVYDTVMVAHRATSATARLAAVLAAVKRVYASTFLSGAKSYLGATSYRLEEEKMAALVQRVVGSAHGNRFYPEISGVARSENFYPTGPMRPEDGVAAVALGLGRTVVEGGSCVRFCPRYPQHGRVHGSFRQLLDSTQRGFWALALDGDPQAPSGNDVWCPLETAEGDGTLAAVASTYSPENESLSTGLARSGQRVVTFAPILEKMRLPLSELLTALLAELRQGVGAPVEIEFAVNLAGRGGGNAELGFLQLRPLPRRRENEALDLAAVAPESLLASSRRALGHGERVDLYDLVVVDVRRFERAKSAEVAAEIGRINAKLRAERAPFALIGIGRWGSRDPWLGIPVAWEQVSGAAVIVEAGTAEHPVTPSQGSHFFHHLTSFRVGYLTVNPEAGDGALDWAWLAAQPARSEAHSVRHLRLEDPIRLAIDGRRGCGALFKPRRGGAG